MLGWQLIVHEAKGVNWFTKSDMPTVDMYAMMAQFYTDVQALKDVILSAIPIRTVTRTDTANVEGNRIDTMIRESGNTIYVFAVRITEFGETGDLTPTLKVATFTENAAATVYGESRTVELTTDGTDATFSDTFSPNAVHIYSFTPNPLAPLPAAGVATMPVPTDAATDQLRNLTLRWTMGEGAVSNDVYWGTDATPDVTEYVGRQAERTYTPPTLANGATYYWRVDEVNGDDVVTTGTVWSLTVKTAPAHLWLPGGLRIH